MRHFTRKGDGIRMDLEAFEVELLLDLRDGIRTALEQPDVADPALHRLFPPAVSGDDVEDAAARATTYDHLLEARLAGLDALGELLERAQVRVGGARRVLLTGDEPELVLGVVNDLRLALAARMGADRERPRDLADDDPRAHGLAVVDHLAWLQEQLLRLLDPEATAHQDDPSFLRHVLDDEDGDGPDR